MPIYTTSKSKENILRKIRTALQEEQVKQPFPDAHSGKSDPVFIPLSMPSLEETFALEFSKSGGHFAFCNDIPELAANLKILANSRNWTEVLCAFKGLLPLLIAEKLPFIREYHLKNETIAACITDCEVAVARTGSLFFSSRQHFGRSSSIYFPIHIVILRPGQFVEDISDGLKFLKTKHKGRLPSMLSLNTGPSRTADIEKTLVKGVHGPKEVFCFLVNY